MDLGARLNTGHPCQKLLGGRGKVGVRPRGAGEGSWIFTEAMSALCEYQQINPSLPADLWPGTIFTGLLQCQINESGWGIPQFKITPWVIFIQENQRILGQRRQ